MPTVELEWHLLQEMATLGIPRNPDAQRGPWTTASRPSPGGRDEPPPFPVGALALACRSSPRSSALPLAEPFAPVLLFCLAAMDRSLERGEPPRSPEPVPLKRARRPPSPVEPEAALPLPADAALPLLEAPSMLPAGDLAPGDLAPGGGEAIAQKIE